jgi:alginate O-acetyltransferase complex protein AlgI
MLFQTPEFVLLMLAVMLGIAMLRKNTTQHIMLVLASYFFYAWLDVRFLILLLLSSCIDFAGALGIAGEKLSWAYRVRLGLYVVVGAILCLGLNWPLLQAKPEHWQALQQARVVAGEITAEQIPAQVWSWSEFLRPGLRVNLFYLSLATCVVFAVVWPLLYEWFFTFRENPRRNAFLAVSMVANLGMLALFKYGDFFLQNVFALLNWLGYSIEPFRLGLELPPGISFYTFVTMSYGIDAWRREIVPERSFLRMSLFVSYFPHLVAGPVIRPDQLLPTLDQPWQLRAERIISGLHLCLVGLFKKVIIADWVARMASKCLGDYDLTTVPTIVLWLGAVMFAVQIYCDFSGYTDIARGVSRMLGVELPLNFNFPYFSRNITEFWRNWHISLSTWLRDYLYIPLGGSRCSPPRVYFNLMATMVLGGLWHGASWNFVVWGAYQGILLCLHRLWTNYTAGWKTLRAVLESVPGQIVSWFITMVLVLLGWLIFYLQALPLVNLQQAQQSYTLWGMMQNFFAFQGGLNVSNLGLGGGSPAPAAIALVLFCILHASSYFYGRWAELLDRWPYWFRLLLYVAVGLIFFYGWPTHQSAFLYFQF